MIYKLTSELFHVEMIEKYHYWKKCDFEYH